MCDNIVDVEMKIKVPSRIGLHKRRGPPNAAAHPSQGLTRMISSNS